VKVAYLGPDGTFSAEALRHTVDAAAHELVPVPGIFEAVMAVAHGEVDRALVPIENSLEGAVNATLDALAVETQDVAIVGEVVHPIRVCLLVAAARAGGATPSLDEITEVVSHPQPAAQCAGFLRTRLPGTPVVAAASTAEAVRSVGGDGSDPPTRAALGTRLAAQLYGCTVLLTGVEDVPDNETRFVWLAPRGTPPEGSGPWKTSLVFWGVGAEAPGWLVRCLSEFAFRGVNLVRIESRPRRQGLGRYMFFVDCEGRADDGEGGAVSEAIAALQGQAEHVRTLGSYPVA